MDRMPEPAPAVTARRFAGQTAIVTGAASGIGRATAERLAAEGARLVLVDLADQVDDAAGELRAAGATAVAVRGDVSAEETWQLAARAARSAGGGVDVVISNAAVNHRLPAHELTRAGWDAQLAVNLTATFLGVRACIGDLAARQGSVVIVSSVHALVGLPGNPAYAAAKGGLTALTRQLAAEYGPAVRVNAVLPGPILTRAWDQTSEEDRRRSIEQTIAKRFGSPAEVAAAIAFLASADAAYITGASLAVDGGWTVFKTSV
jgi:NAD(P)-dependent dehydrogenase (short-subunit alcohol dehydrogenase family)